MKVYKDKLLRMANLLVVFMSLLIVVSMVILIQLVRQNENDGTLINTSGRQRYLSQKLTKTSILLIDNKDSIDKGSLVKVLKEDLKQFKTNNTVLLNQTDSKTVLALLEDIQPKFNTIFNNAEGLIEHQKDRKFLDKILTVESFFLESMNRIVMQYELENKEAIENFIIYLGIVSLLLILSLLFFIYQIIRPVIISNKNNQEIISNQNAELVKLNKNKDVFINILAHDLRGPFGGILGLLHILEENYRNTEVEVVENQIKVTHDTAKKVYKLLDKLLSWARLQAGKMSFSRSLMELAPICDEIIELIRVNANAKHIQLKHSVSKDVTVFADKDMLSTILRNLVSNAVKFTPDGGVIHITAEKTIDAILVTVTDSGIGMDKETQKKLFELSKMFTTEGTNHEKGTGLGLLLCKEFVEKHQGTIWVESEIGKGSKFNFTIPNKIV